MDFSEAIRAQLSGQTVRIAELLRLDFTSGVQRLWTGFGRLVTNDGAEWLGTAGYGKVGQLAQSINGTAPEQRFELSGVDASFAGLANEPRAVWYNRPVMVFYQFFGGTPGVNLWQPLDMPFAVDFVRMRTLITVRDSEDDGFVYTIRLSAEGLFAGKQRPKAAYMTPTDQKMNYPGDKGMDRVPGIQSKNIKYPDY